jgi:hypothetical protein
MLRYGLRAIFKHAYTKAKLGRSLNLITITSTTMATSSTIPPSSTPSWKFRDLTVFWPLNKLPDRLPPRFLGKGVFEGTDASSGGGWRFRVSEKVGEYREYLIPPHYANALAVLNAKIVWLHVFQTKRFTTSSEDEKDILKQMKDSIARSLIFTVDVRTIFLADIAHEFYNGERQFDKPFTIDDAVFRSPALDSWLYVEYSGGAHAPLIYREISQRSQILMDPLLVDLNGEATFLSHWRVLI